MSHVWPVVSVICLTWVVYPPATMSKAEREDRAREEGKASWAFKELVEAEIVTATDDQLDELLQHEEASIALAASWEQVRRSYQQSTVPGKYEPTPVALSRFFGFVEGRTQMAITPKWEKVVTKGAAIREGESFGSIDRDDPLIGSQEDVGFTVVGDALNVTIDDKTVTLPGVDTEYINFIAVEVADGIAYCAPMARFPEVPPLFAVDIAKNEVLWSAEIWQFPQFQGSSMTPPTKGIMDIRISESTVVVSGFVCQHVSAFIEGFEKDTGRTVFRFNTGSFGPVQIKNRTKTKPE